MCGMEWRDSVAGLTSLKFQVAWLRSRRKTAVPSKSTSSCHESDRATEQILIINHLKTVAGKSNDPTIQLVAHYSSGNTHFQIHRNVYAERSLSIQ